MALINIAGKSYELLLENKAGWNAEAFRNRYSEVLERYDYIVGDWGYNQLRLKGFFKDGNNKATKDSTFSYVLDYINEYCNFGCAYFVLEKTFEQNENTDTTEEVDPLLADLDHEFEAEQEQLSSEIADAEQTKDAAEQEAEVAEIKSVKPQQHRHEKHGQHRSHDKPAKRRPVKHRQHHSKPNHKATENGDDNVAVAVKEPTKKKRRPNRPFKHFDRKKNKEQVTSTQE